MIELLVKARDSETDDENNFKTGYIVAVKEYPNSGWGKAEGPPEFAVIRVNGLSAEECKIYMEKWKKKEAPDALIRYMYPDSPETIRNEAELYVEKNSSVRRFYIDPGYVKKITDKGGFIKINKSALLKQIRDRQSVRTE
jgi:hypothetical protein